MASQMFSATYDLANFVCYDARTPLEMSVSSTIHVNPCQAFPSISEFLHKLQIGNVSLVYRKPLELRFRLYTGECYSPAWFESLVRSWQDALLQAELWKDLGFQIPEIFPIEETKRSNEHSGGFSLCLRFAVPAAPVKQSSGLSRHSDIHSLRPPEGILTASLEVVEISISITSKEPILSPRTFKRYRSDKIEACPEAEMLLDDNVLFMEIQSTKPPEDGEMFEPLELTHLHPLPGKHQESNECLVPCHDSLLQIRQRGSLGSVAGLIKPNKKGNRSTSINSETKLLGGMLDAALRNVICDKPRRVPPSIWIKFADKRNTLESVYPLLWSPGYAANIADRLNFLPTIGDALLSISKRSRCNDLKRKLAAVSAMPLNESNNEQGTPNLVRTGIQMQLWKIMERSFRETRNARFLNPIQFSSDKDSFASGESFGSPILAENRCTEYPVDQLYCDEEILDDPSLELGTSLNLDFEDLFSEFEPLDEERFYSDEETLEWDSQLQDIDESEEQPSNTGEHQSTNTNETFECLDRSWEILDSSFVENLQHSDEPRNDEISFEAFPCCEFEKGLETTLSDETILI